MTQALTYFPILKSYSNTYCDKGLFSLRWAGSTVVLGIFARYAPRTFIACSLALVPYQIAYFNQIVQNNNGIRSWTIHACLLMGSVGAAFGFQAVPHFVAAYTAFKDRKIVSTIGHSFAGMFKAGIFASLTTVFWNRAHTLASSARWIDMEDYLGCYSPEIKKAISLRKRVAFYASAILPETFIGRLSAQKDLLWCQFSSRLTKYEQLVKYLSKTQKIPSADNKNEWIRWLVAIHYFQVLLPDEMVKNLIPVLERIAKESSPDQVEQLPKELLSHLNSGNPPQTPAPMEPANVQEAAQTDKPSQSSLDQFRQYATEIKELRTKPANFDQMLKNYQTARTACLKVIHEYQLYLGHEYAQEITKTDSQVQKKLIDLSQSTTSYLYSFIPSVGASPQAVQSSIPLPRSLVEEMKEALLQKDFSGFEDKLKVCQQYLNPITDALGQGPAQTLHELSEAFKKATTA